MKPSLLITGAGGFLGQHLLKRLDPSKYGKIYCLTRKMENVRLPDPTPGNIRIIEGDLLTPTTYDTVLDQVDTVIHLAAATGKVDPDRYFKVNAYGTMLLLDRCKQEKSKVKHFLFVSSIAVSFKNKYRYFYALSKEQAESYVETSGLKYTILRPTMIMGKGSPVFDGLARLAGLPVIPVFGKGKNPVQPILVDDVVKAIIQIENDAQYHGEILELGGPETISIEDFMKRIARKMGKKSPVLFHLPVGLIVFFLSILERVVYGFLPLTVGQLGTFRNDGTAKENPLAKKLSPLMAGLEEIVEKSLEQDKPIDIPEPLRRECRVFSQYLVNQTPNNYILEKYHRCHQKVTFEPSDFHDSFLLKLASNRPFFTRMTDAYSRFFRSNSVVRKKLAYLMAILETSPPYFRFYDSTDTKEIIGFVVKAGIKGMGMALHLSISFIFLFPLQLAAKIVKRKPAAQGTSGV